MHDALFPTEALRADELRSEVLRRCESFSASTRNALPRWFEGDAAHFLQSTTLIVCGSVCGEEIRLLVRNAKVAAIVDDFCQDAQIFGIPVITSADWVRRVRADATIVSVLLLPGDTGYNFFVRRAIQFGFRTIDPVQLLLLIREASVSKSGCVGPFFVYGLEFFDGVMNDIAKLDRVGPIFDDDFSRATFYSLLLYRLTLNPNYLRGVGVGHGVTSYCANAYVFNEEFFRFGDDEVYVDCGSFVGQTIEGFIRASNGKFTEIFSFEPSESNVASIHARLAALSNEFPHGIDTQRITITQKGVWSSETELHYFRGQSVLQSDPNQFLTPQSAHFVEGGILDHMHDYVAEESILQTLPVTTIDAVTGGRATLIKLEIEGSELEALKGATNTITSSRPSMALSVYHKPEDLHTIAGFVDGLDLGYCYSLRQHNPLVPDATVMYCYLR